MKFVNFTFLISILFLTSCSSKKDVLYMQNAPDFNITSEYKDYKLQYDDILKIVISTEIPEMSANLNYNSQITTLNTKEGMILNGYQVNSSGKIYMPTLGEFYVLGKSLNELRNMIFNRVTDNQLLLNPSIDIKHINAHFTVIGEVNLPGRHDFLQNNLNIIEAIGIAGDLTINGKRDDVRLIRQTNGKMKVHEIDLTNGELINEDYFQIFSGDIIIVNPNYNRVKNAGIIGNSGTLISLLSFLLTSIIVINN